MLCHQLIHSAKSLSATSATTNQYLAEDEAAPFPCTITLPSNMVSDLSSPDFGSSSDKQIIRAIPDANGKTHYLVKFNVTKDPSEGRRLKNENARSVWAKMNEEMSATIV
jgi:hypothetical protein